MSRTVRRLASHENEVERPIKPKAERCSERVDSRTVRAAGPATRRRSGPTVRLATEACLDRTGVLSRLPDRPSHGCVARQLSS